MYSNMTCGVDDTDEFTDHREHSSPFTSQSMHYIWQFISVLLVSSKRKSY